MNKTIIRLYKYFTSNKTGKALGDSLKKKKLQYFEYSLQKNLNIKRKKYGSCVVIMATPFHGNLGDHAIVTAEYKFLKDLGYGENIIEISNDEYYKYKEIIKKHIKCSDMIVIDGGGNMGTLWTREDDKISEIIKTYKNNKIVVFPQTCYYDKSNEAKIRLQHNKAIYNSAKKLTICLRDRASYEFCTRHFEGTNFIFMPDIVLYMCPNIETKRENKSLICFREDVEKEILDDEVRKIYRYLAENKINTERFSTIYPGCIGRKDRKSKLENMWTKISESKLVITDRLHGMIFSTITGTPCLALDNKSKKVSGVYEWFCDLGYICVCNTVEELIGKIPEFYNMNGNKYNPDLLSGEAFIQLRMLLEQKEEIKNDA